MEKYFVFETYRYRASGSWEYKAVGAYDTLYEAKNKFHERKAAITKQSNDYVMVIVVDARGNKIYSDYDDTRDPEPEPNEEA